jgi:hypothetical protein
MRHVVLISGKDSLAAALLQTARHPGLPYEYVFNDVGAELPETYAWLARVEAATGWDVRRVGADLRLRIAAYGGFLPSRRQRYCTKETKILPTERLIGYDPCTVYYGLRADEPRSGYVPVGRPNVTPAYPLREAGIDLRGVYAILDAQSLAPPDFFWPRLYAAVSARLAGSPGWESALSRWERVALFAGRSRANCFMCFFQRRYEYVWLYETHPGLFREAAAMEREDYHFRADFPLSSLDDPALRAKLFGKRVDAVVRAVTARLQGELFPEPADNGLALVSCGLLCGK